MLSRQWSFDRTWTLDRPTRLVLAVIVLGTAARVITGAITGLGVDESYTAAVALPLSLSYFDHPPLSFWIPGLLQLAGIHDGLLLRLPFILLFAGTTWLMFRLGSQLFGPGAGACAALLLNLSPVFSLSTAGWVLPDGPLVFFMLAATLCAERVLLHDTAYPNRWWLATGACAGLAMLSKYHGVFVPAGILLYLLTQPQQRVWLRRSGPYLGAAVALLLFGPVLAWNGAHDWISFQFQGGRAAPVGAGLHLLSLLRSLVGQALYLLPWIWIPLVVVLVGALRAGPRDDRRWLLVCLGIGPIILFTLPSLGGRPGLPHWEAPGYLMLYPLLGAAVDRRIRSGARVVRPWLVGSAAAYLLLLALAASQAAAGWWSRAFPSLFRAGDPTRELVDWRDLRTAVHDGHLLDQPGRFLAATRWLDAGKVAFAMGWGIPTVCLCRTPHHFHFVHPQQQFLGRDALIVEPPDAPATAVRSLAQHFRSLETLGTVVVHRAGHPEFQLRLVLGRTFLQPIPVDMAR